MAAVVVAVESLGEEARSVGRRCLRRADQVRRTL
jgi:hypothetical protein